MPNAIADRGAKRAESTSSASSGSRPAQAEENSFTRVNPAAPEGVGRTPLKYSKLRDAPFELTPEAAQEFLSLQTFHGERRRSPTHAQFLYDEYKAGRFVWDHVILATAKLGREVYHINGQHTAMMRLNLPANATAAVRRVDYEVKNEDQLRALYGVFDRNVGRTPSQVLKSLIAGRPGVDHIADSAINVIGSGLRLWKWGGRSDGAFRRTGPYDVANAVLDQHRDVFAAVAKFFREHVAQFPQLKRSSVVGALFATFAKDPKAAEEFWTPVCDGLDLAAKDDPRWQLRTTLQNSLQRADVGTRINTRRVRLASNEDVYNMALQAWNKWRRGDSVKVLRPMDSRPEVE